MNINKIDAQASKRITSLTLATILFTGSGSASRLQLRRDQPDCFVDFSSNNEVPLSQGVFDTLDINDGIPRVYLEQMAMAGIDTDNLHALRELELHVIKGNPLNWLVKCSNLQRLSLVLEETPEPGDFVLDGSLVNLRTLVIDCKKCEYFEDFKAYEKALQNHKTRCFLQAMNAGYNQEQKRYYVEYVPYVELGSFMTDFVTHLPNISNLSMSSFLYTEPEDLMWVANISSLTYFYTKPYFERDWDLKENILAIINNNPLLNTLYVLTNGYRLTTDNYELVKSLNKTDIAKICFQGVYKSSFRYTKDGKVRTLEVGLADKLDYDELTGIDIIDFSRVGIYYALIYMSERDYDYIKAQGIEVIFGENYTEDDFRKLARTLDQMSENLNIPVVASEQMRLNMILQLILDKYHYGPVNKSIDIENKYYKDGTLYACFTGDELVCGNYAALINALLYRQGIESYYIRSDKHAWVLAKIDGQYYYIDPTIIDSVYDSKVQSGFEKSEAFNEALKIDLYLLNPLDLEVEESQIDFAECYKDAKIPYDLDVYRKDYTEKKGKELLYKGKLG